MGLILGCGQRFAFNFHYQPRARTSESLSCVSSCSSSHEHTERHVFDQYLEDVFQSELHSVKPTLRECALSDSDSVCRRVRRADRDHRRVFSVGLVCSARVLLIDYRTTVGVDLGLDQIV